MTLTVLLVRAIQATRAGDETRHGSVRKTRQWARHARYLMFVGMAAFYDTLTMEILALLPSSDPEEAEPLVRKREQREKQSNIAKLPATQWTRGGSHFPVTRLPGHGSWNPPLAVIENIQPREECARRCTTRGAKTPRSLRAQCHWTTIGQPTHQRERTLSRTRDHSVHTDMVA